MRLKESKKVYRFLGLDIIIIVFPKVKKEFPEDVAVERSRKKYLIHIQEWKEKKDEKERKTLKKNHYYSPLIL